jgi:hypothetical protein
MLRLDADGEGRPKCEWPRRRFPLIRLAFVVLVFLAGLGIGFVWGRGAASPASNSGVSATSVGVFSASNNVVVSEKTVVSAPPPAKPQAGVQPAQQAKP